MLVYDVRMGYDMLSNRKDDIVSLFKRLTLIVHKQYIVRTSICTLCMCAHLCVVCVCVCVCVCVRCVCVCGVLCVCVLCVCVVCVCVCVLCVCVA